MIDGNKSGDVRIVVSYKYLIDEITSLAMLLISRTKQKKQTGSENGDRSHLFGLISWIHQVAVHKDAIQPTALGGPSSHAMAGPRRYGPNAMV